MGATYNTTSTNLIKNQPIGYKTPSTKHWGPQETLTWRAHM